MWEWSESVAGARYQGSIDVVSKQYWDSTKAVLNSIHAVSPLHFSMPQSVSLEEWANANAIRRYFWSVASRI